MAKNSVMTQGTEVCVLVPTEADPTKFEVLTIEDVIEFDPGEDTADDIEVTPLSERKARQYMAGLETPAEAKLTINVNPQDPVHVRLYALRNKTLKWALGWSDGTATPTLSSPDGDDFTLPTTRTWFTFDGHIKTFPFSFEGNNVVKTAITIKRSGESKWVHKAVAP